MNAIKSSLLELAYRLEVFASRVQGIAFDHPSINGEYKLIDRLSPFVRIAVDGGANLGDWSNQVFARIPGVRVALVEPMPANAAYLGQRFSIQGDRAVLCHGALSSTSGTLRFVGDTSLGAGTGFVTNNAQQSGIEVPAITLTEVARRLGGSDLDLVKLDIEGEEMAALKGAEELLRKEKIGVVQVEYNSTWLRTNMRMEYLFELANRFGYGLMVLTPWGPMRLTHYGQGLEDYRLRNIILVRRDFIEHLRAFASSGRARVESLRAGASK